MAGQGVSRSRLLVLKQVLARTGANSRSVMADSRALWISSSGDMVMHFVTMWLEICCACSSARTANNEPSGSCTVRVSCATGDEFTLCMGALEKQSSPTITDLPIGSLRLTLAPLWLR